VGGGGAKRKTPVNKGGGEPTPQRIKRGETSIGQEGGKKGIN
jgi:hypothetical protein